jgi:hypothetical protein
MTQGRKLKESGRLKERFARHYPPLLRDHDAEKPQHRSQRSKKQRSMTMLSRWHKQRKSNQQGKSRSKSPTAQIRVTPHYSLLCLNISKKAPQFRGAFL